MINQASPLRSLKYLLQADLVVLVRNKKSLIISIILPIFLLFIWHNEGTTKALGGSFFIIALCITIGLLSSSLMGYSLAVGRDREKGIFQRLRVTPAPSWTIMVSRLLSQMIANLIIAVLVIVVGVRLYHISADAGQYVTALLVSILAGALFLSIGQAVVGLVKSADTINATSRILYIALMLLGIFGATNALGHTFNTIAKWTPVGTVIAVFESVLHEVAWNGHTTLALLACFGYIIVCSAIGIIYFQWDAR